MVVQSYVPIKDLENGQRYKQIFMVSEFRNAKTMRTIQGKRFARLTLQDTTGTIDGVIWGYEDICEIHPGDFVQIEIEVQPYGEHLEFKTNLTSIDEPLKMPPENIFDYIQGMSEIALEAYVTELEEYLGMISDSHYNDIVGNALSRLELMHTLKVSPYGLTGPLAYAGGLLVHIVHSLRFARVATKQARENETPLNTSLIITGCLLRNIGWHTTTRFQGKVLRPRDAFYMTGPHRASMRFVNHLILTTETDISITIPEAKQQALENLCAPAGEIRTLEGQIVARSDDLADLMDFGRDMLDKRSMQENWSPDVEGFFVGHHNV